MRILVACEESQAVTIAFRERGHEAYSCDVQPCSGGHPEWHIQGDVMPLLREKWDMLIAFPPCTYLSQAGDVRLYPRKRLDVERYAKLVAGKNFFMSILNSDCSPKVAVENPLPTKIANIPPPSQMIQPYFFGDAVRKRTFLWLRGLPPLVAFLGGCIVQPTMNWISAGGKGRHEHAVAAKHRDQKTRSKTFPGIARAMAEQWG